MWIQKYKPRRFSEIIGNRTLVEFLKRYDWKKPLLLYGPPGTGKSALVEVIANEFDFDIVEITERNIENAIAISQSMGLYGKRKLIVIDNVDMVPDMRKITELLRRTKNPTILITSDINSKRLSSVKRLCNKISTRRLSSASIKNILYRICRIEGIPTTNEVLMKIAENSNGDIRAAINDLETIAKGRKKIELEDLGILSIRDRSMEIYKALSMILIKGDFSKAYKSLMSLDEQPRDVLLWVDENLPRVYRDKNDIEKAYYYLSRADIFLGRIIRRQYWGFLRYVNIFISGASISRSNGINFVRYQFPAYFARLGKTKKERNMKKSIGQKLSTHLHSSSRIIAEQYIPLIGILINNGKLDENVLKERYDITDEEIEFIKSF